MNTFQSGIVQVFQDSILIDIEFVINKKLEEYADDKFNADTTIEAYVVPYNHLRIIGSHGVDGTTYGYFDVVLNKGGTIKSWSLVGNTSAYEAVSKFYDVEHWL